MRKGIGVFLVLMLSLTVLMAGCEEKMGSGTSEQKQGSSFKKENGKNQTVTEPIDPEPTVTPENIATEPQEPSEELTEPATEPLISVWVISEKSSESAYGGGIRDMIAVFDKQGNLLEKTEQNGDTPISKYTYQYDDNGNLIMEAEYAWNNAAWEEYSRVAYVYDEDDLLLEVTFYEFGTEISRKTYTYDDSGRMIGQTDYQYGDAVFQYTYSYDENGNCIGVMRQYNNQSSYQRTKEYDESDRLIRFCEFYNDVQSYDCTYTYDEAGRLSEKVAAYLNSGSVYRTVCQYDVEGRLTETVSYIDDDLYNRISYMYDDKGNLIEEVVLLDGVENYRSVYRYDERGMLLTQTSYEEGMQIIHTEFEMVLLKITPEQKERLISQGMVFADVDSSYLMDGSI